ncbi:MAG: ClpX C4-type zinc finger protein, partial [Planctomycetota bacterium]|nr:ClpX C4-type zinc finger protein [Planctomycetota bacterium]
MPRSSDRDDRDPRMAAPRPQAEPVSAAAQPPQGGDGPGSGGGGGDQGGDGGPTGSGGSGGGGFRGRKITTCSFCGKTSREVGPMVEGPGDVYICTNCTDLCQNIFRQERRRVDRGRPLFSSIPTPRQLREFL